MAVRSIEQVEDTIKKYYLLLNKAGLPVEKIILFGSYSANRQNENSDIDVAVILKNFTEDKFETRLKLMKYCRDFEEVIEPHPFSEDEFNTSNPFAAEILKHGILIC
jgi:predicted nucleotidyltransferase